MWELGHKEGWAPKNWCFWTVVLEETLESSLYCKKIKPVNPEGNQSWIFIGRTDAESEAPILWPPDLKNWLTGKDPDAGKDWRQEKGTAEDEMVAWHHWLDGHEFEQAPGTDDGQGSLAYCSWTWLNNWTTKKKACGGRVVGRATHINFSLKVLVAQSCPMLYNFMDCRPGRNCACLLSCIQLFVTP